MSTCIACAGRGCLPLRCPHDARGAADAAGCARRLTPFSLVPWHSPLRLLKLRIITLITPTASLCILFDLPHHDFSFFTLFTLFQLFVLFFGQKEKNWVVSLGILSGSSSGSSFPLSYISRIFLHVLNPLLPNVRTLSFWLYTLLLHPPLSSFSNAFFILCIHDVCLSRPPLIPFHFCSVLIIPLSFLFSFISSSHAVF